MIEKSKQQDFPTEAQIQYFNSIKPQTQKEPELKPRRMLGATTVEEELSHQAASKLTLKAGQGSDLNVLETELEKQAFKEHLEKVEAQQP